MPIYIFKHQEAEKFFTYLTSIGEKRPKHSAYVYSKTVDNFLEWCEKRKIDYKNLTEMDLEDYYDSLRTQLNYSDRTLANKAFAIQLFLSKIRPFGMQRLELPKPRYVIQKIPYLNFDMIKKIISGSVPLSVAYDLALRVGEVPLLRLSKTNFDTGIIEVQRLKQKRVKRTFLMKLSPEVLEMLKNYIHGDRDRDLNRYYNREWTKLTKSLRTIDNLSGTNIVSQNRVMTEKTEILKSMKELRENLNDILLPFTVFQLQAEFKSRCQSLGLEGYTFHALRHSRITNKALEMLKEKGVIDLISLKEFAGHNTSKTTEIYIHLAEEIFSGK